MSETLTERILTRFAPTDHEKLRVAAEAAGLTKTEAVRLATMRVVEEGSLGKPRPPVTNDRDLIQQHRTSVAAFKSEGDPILEARGLISRDHRDAVLTEVGGDAALVATVARAIELEVDCSELLAAEVEDYFSRNPGADIVWSLPAPDLCWMELRMGDAPVIPDENVTCVAAAVERADMKTKWKWACRLLKKMHDDGTDVYGLFIHCSEWGGWRLKARPRLRSYSKGGARHWAVGKPDDTAPPKPVLSETDAVARGIRGGIIGGTTPAATAPAAAAPTRIRRGQIGGGGETP